MLNNIDSADHDEDHLQLGDNIGGFHLIFALDSEDLGCFAWQSCPRQKILVWSDNAWILEFWFILIYSIVERASPTTWTSTSLMSVWNLGTFTFSHKSFWHHHLHRHHHNFQSHQNYHSSTSSSLPSSSSSFVQRQVQPWRSSANLTLDCSRRWEAAVLQDQSENISDWWFVISDWWFVISHWLSVFFNMNLRWSVISYWWSAIGDWCSSRSIWEDQQEKSSKNPEIGWCFWCTCLYCILGNFRHNLFQFFWEKKTGIFWKF